jgi:hypothetical protein
MWTVVVTYKLPMGDEFIVQRYQNAFGASRWRGLIKKKKEQGTRVCCPSSPLKMLVDEYFKIVCLCQQDCLEGRNPYVSKNYALSYRDL